MKRGCLVGCALFAGAAAALAALAAHQARRLPAFERTDEVATAAYMGRSPAFAFEMHTQSPYLRDMIVAGMAPLPRWIAEELIPAEFSFTVDGDGAWESAERDEAMPLVFALGMRRFAGLLEFAVRDPETWRWWEGQEVASARQEAPGVYVVRSRLPWPGDLDAFPAGPWPLEGAAMEEAPPSASIVLRLDNRGGRAFGALLPLTADMRDGTAVLPEEFVDTARLKALFDRVLAAWMTIEFLSADRMLVRARLDAPAPAAAEGALLPLLAFRDALFRALLEEGVVLEGEWRRAGRTISGDFTVSGYRPLVIRGVEQRMQ